MIFNGIDFSGLAWLITEEAYPPESVGRKNVWHTPDGAASRLVRTNRVPYLRKVTVRIKASTRADVLYYRRELIGKLQTDDVAKLELPNETTYEMAKLEAFDTGNWELETLPIELIFLCPSGCAYGTDQTKAIGTVYVGGTENTPPYFAITPAATTVEISNGTDHLHFDGLTVGTAVTIDVGTRTPMQGLSSIRSKLSFSSDYFDLSPGSNTLTITGGTGTVKFTERWR